MNAEPAPPAGGDPPNERRKRSRPRLRWGFSKGAAVGLLAWIPLCGAGLWLMARLGLVSRSSTLVECLRMTAIFSSLPAVLTAGGVGRLAAQAGTEPLGSRRRAAVVAGRAMAAAGAALTIIAAIPLGGLPREPWGWVMLATGGAMLGGVVGAWIGLACGGPLPSLAELGMVRIEPIEWTRDLLGWEDRPTTPGAGEPPPEKRPARSDSPRSKP